ncbi:hypothetical protein BCT41_22590 [Vibrio splendidus]|uniref:hypothetical protein n=1 Tax=Vibrio splendidus TaxID=29497 RepID=UPI000CA6D945|nr:hypothetical protein BCT41_22590 [Vibrio splendidus]
MLITMSEKDIHRFKVLTDVHEKRLRLASLLHHRFAKPAQYPKDMHRPVRESKQELDENSRLTHETVKILDYPNGEIAIQYGHRKLEFKTFDKLEHVQQTQIVDNKRLGQVLKWD